MFYRRFDRRTCLTFALALALSAVPALATDKTPDKDKQPQPEAASAAKAKDAKAGAEAAKAPAPPASGVVLKPQEVDGTVSAYASAVRKVDPAAKVYTNADLEKIFAGDTRPWATQPSSVAVDEAADAPTPAEPLEWLEAEGARAQDRARAIADAETELAAAQAAVANLEKQLVSARNPYAPRAELSEEEKAARASGDTVAARVERAEKDLAAARERVATAQARLNQARRGE